ncbi:prepilin-type N-terminal cleavage/methylation domain-containing protein [Desulfosporosinus sp.]|uniref:prepilin-type N-terminal cleavage/methylation domain-containing protein n=1 Tax=Desulfosporosinus sp. TaxID=157907 RepID=UPI0025BD0599|nr:prepilin-type N-terminal cleavage/methylation domain-containing protein [Desulfosporosinus sp.]MBC2726913.1 prepilin-type N-terminal cleavage/methylation domain-containing protein [Desulfosporosinus sp.]
MFNNKGFTLIEIIIVLVIIGIISATAYPSLSVARDMANENDRAAHEKVVNKALIEHYALTGAYPNQGVHDSSTPNLTASELSALASDLAQETGVRLNTAKYKYTYVLNGSGIYGVNSLHVDLR